MKQAFGIFTAIMLMPTFSVQAWIGGPFSNNSFQTNGDDGIYEAVGSMTDGTAMYRWAVNNEEAGGVTLLGGQTNAGATSNVQFGGLVGAQNPHVIWYRGMIYYGRCFGIVNSNMNTVLVTGNASDNALNGAQGEMNGVNLNTGSTSSLEFNAGNGAATTVPDRKRVANSTWRGKITKRYPMKRFHGRGNVAFIGEPNFDVVIVNTGGAGAPPGVTVTSVSTSSSSSQFLPIGHRVGMKIFGTQVSFQVNG